MSEKYLYRGMAILLSVLTFIGIIGILAVFSIHDIKAEWLKDVVVPYVALVVAISALMAAVWQGVNSERHNRMSIRPYLEITYTRWTGKPVTISVMNKGTGPAILENVYYKVGGRKYSGSSKKEIQDAVTQSVKDTHALKMKAGSVPKSSSPAYWTGINKFLELYKGDAIGPDEEREILIMPRSTPSKNPSNFTQNDVMDYLRLNIEYSSLYSDEKYLTPHIPIRFRA